MSRWCTRTRHGSISNDLRRCCARPTSFGPSPANSHSIAGSAYRSFSPRRSEEHTSELQSQSNLVCRLLLEKKKKKTEQPETQRLVQMKRRSQVALMEG